MKQSRLAVAVALGITGSVCVTVEAGEQFCFNDLGAESAAIYGSGEISIGPLSQKVEREIELRFPPDARLNFTASERSQVLLSMLPMIPGTWGNPQPKVVVLTNASGATWTVPNDWNSANNTVEGLGPGSKGSNGGNGNTSAGGAGGAGNGGGAYTKLSNFSASAGASIAISIPLGSVVNPGDTTFNSTSLVAKAGSSTGGGSAASCTPSAGAQSGGAGAAGGAANASGGVGGGGGGAAGPTGAGSNAVGQTHGSAGSGTFADGTTRQGPGGDGANSPGSDTPGIGGGAGSNYGGGGAGGSGGGQAISAGTRSGGGGGTGGGGLILIRYISLF